MSRIVTPNPRPSTSWLRAIPNALTLANLCCGLLALGVVWYGYPLWGALLLLAAALTFDLFDGRVARALGTSNPMGAQLDSLADLISFGLVPAAVLYEVALQPLGVVGVIAACAMVAAAAWRLARFTVGASEPADHAGPACFEGLPVTIPAAIVAGIAGAAVALHPAGAVGLALGLAYLMVSRVPFRSFKDRPVYVLLIPLLVLLVGASLSSGSLLVGLGTTLVIAGGLFALSGPAAVLAARLSAAV